MTKYRSFLVTLFGKPRRSRTLIGHIPCLLTTCDLLDSSWDELRLISAFFARTGVPMVLNTSFNVMGEPIVDSPQGAHAFDKHPQTHLSQQQNE